MFSGSASSIGTSASASSAPGLSDGRRRTSSHLHLGTSIQRMAGAPSPILSSPHHRVFQVRLKLSPPLPSLYDGLDEHQTRQAIDAIRECADRLPFGIPWQCWISQPGGRPHWPSQKPPW